MPGVTEAGFPVVLPRLPVGLTRTIGAFVLNLSALRALQALGRLVPESHPLGRARTPCAPGPVLLAKFRFEPQVSHGSEMAIGARPVAGDSRRHEAEKCRQVGYGSSGIHRRAVRS